MVDREALRTIVSEYGESDHKSENSNFLLVVRQKYSLGELFSKIYFKSFSEFVCFFVKCRKAAQSTKIANCAKIVHFQQASTEIKELV